MTGSAPIVRGDVGAARDLAFKRALGIAASSGHAAITNQAQFQRGELDETTHVVSYSCTRDARIIGERIANNEIALEVSVTLDSGSACPSQCQVEYTNKLIVAGFAMAYPEHLETGESSNINFIATEDLARALRQGKRIRVDTAESVFPYVSAEKAPELEPYGASKNSPFAMLASKTRSQYIVTGVWRDFSLRRQMIVREARMLMVDIFIHDGGNGALLAHRQFGRTATGDVRTSTKLPFGSPRFYRTDLGEAWTQLFADIASWVFAETSCLPFIARVVKVDGKNIVLDAGADSGLSVGATLRLHRWKPANIVNNETGGIEQEKSLGIRFQVSSLYPSFAIAEPAESRFSFQVQPGDLLFLK